MNPRVLGVSFYLLTGSWKEKEKRGELFQHCVPAGSLPYQLRVLGQVTPVSSVFPSLEPGAIGPPDRGENARSFYCAGSKLGLITAFTSISLVLVEEETQS